MLKKINKKAISEMLSYVILIALAVGLAVGVYAWMKDVSNANPTAECDPDTSLYIDSYNCYTGDLPGHPAGIDLVLKNNGRFNINGVIVTIGDDSNFAPTYFLRPDEVTSTKIAKGHYFFPVALQPTQTFTAEFSNKNELGNSLPFNQVAVIEIQPFVLKTSGKIICQNAVIKQKLTDCLISP